MSTISELYEKVKALDIDRVSVDAVAETKDDYRDLNKGQLEKGINAKGDIVGVYASRQYAAFKQAIGSKAPYGIVDLLLTKAFQNAIRVDVTNLSIITDSTDSKSGDLQAKYGKEIFGLNDESARIYVEEDLRPAFNRKIEEQTGLKFK